MSKKKEIRSALKAFEPLVPEHVMTALTKVIDGHLIGVTSYDIQTYKAKVCDVCGYVWDAAFWGDDFKCLMCHPITFMPPNMFGDASGIKKFVADE